MTMVQQDRGTDEQPEDPTLERDLDDLRRAFADHPFPTRQDDLIAACLGRHEPTRLACRLSKISRTREYATLDEVLADVAAAATAAAAASAADEQALVD
ncbi:hypothetical protein [uncultured Phycicoccus sp.]|uniref:DUF2795 domain-containing protein n=1 Tax=uncultured Phycicoccus sp. TaxID=661422 RepID=UPI00262147C2|nr:hypothetical protein [uncultured Phycicoccus sp.]